MRTLLATSYLPHHSLGHGGAKVLAEIANYFASRHELWIISFLHHPDELQLAEDLKRKCAHVSTVPLPLGLFHLVGRRIRSLRKGEPLLVSCYDVPQMWKEIESVLERQSFDLVQMDLPWMGQYVKLALDTSAKTVLLELDVAVKPLRRSYELEKSRIRRLWRRRQLRSMERYEPAICDAFDLVYAVSEEDRDLLHSLNPGLRVSLLRYGVDEDLLAIGSKLEDERTLVFLGSFLHPPNVDAARHLCESIWPQVRANVPDARLRLVGGFPPDAVKQLASLPNVTVTGWVSDVGAELAKADVCVVPLRHGGGVKFKTLEMMAAGRPVVTTSVGCEGISVVDGQHVMIADTSQDFAAKVVRLLQDGAMRRSLAAEARTLIQRDHRWEASLGRLEKECEALIGGGETPHP